MTTRTTKMRHAAAAFVLGLASGSVSAVEAEPARGPDTIIGMYVHQHWPYRHPYAARTWTLDDWHGYIDGLRRLGYNTVLIWPVLETMPEPLTESDRANLVRIAKVIDMAHDEFGMRAYLALCPNVVADSAVALQASFERRHFFHCDLRVNPADKDAVARMMRWRESLFRPLAKTDGVFIIDSDPGGYPNSTNEEFAGLLMEHRRMFDRLRPGIELVYWVWAGWPAYGRYYATETFAWGEAREFQSILTLLKEMKPEPWGLAHGLEYARAVGLADKVINLRYGAIEDEPSFPLTNFGGDSAYDGGKALGPRGIMGNAQTHCVQLPNTFAFARGAMGKPVTEADYVAFADGLIGGRGAAIVEAWKALSGSDPNRMRATAEKLERLSNETLTPGALKGLLFGDARRFVIDLVLQLRYQAAFVALAQAVSRNEPWPTPLAEYLTALEAWYAQHGYQNYWGSAADVLLKLNAPEINEVFHPRLLAATPFGRIKEEFYVKELFTERLLAAIRKVVIRVAPPEQPTTQPSAAFSFRLRGRAAADRAATLDDRTVEARDRPAPRLRDSMASSWQRCRTSPACRARSARRPRWPSGSNCFVTRDRSG